MEIGPIRHLKNSDLAKIGFLIERIKITLFVKQKPYKACVSWNFRPLILQYVCFINPSSKKFLTEKCEGNKNIPRPVP